MPSDEDFHKLNTWRLGGFGKYTRFPDLFPSVKDTAAWLLSEEILMILGKPNPLILPWLRAQVPKLGFDANQVFRDVMLGQPPDPGMRKEFFLEMDQLAEAWPFGK